MSNSPTAKTKRRPPVDFWFIKLALEAQGYKCFCCGDALTLATCQRGHIDKRNLDDSNDGPENVAPICESCNRQHAKSEITPHDKLAPDYFERLRILILARIPGQISCKVMAPSRKVILTTHVDENTHFIDLQNSEFDPRTEVCIRSRKLTPDEARRIVDDFVAATMQGDDSVPAPDDLAQRLMISKVMDAGADAFLRVGNRVVRFQRWRTADRRIDLLFWKREIVDNFFRHEKGARREELVREENRQRERDAWMAARWACYLRSGLCGDWPAMSDEDRAFRDGARSEKDSPVRELSAEECERAERLPGREFHAKRKLCLDFTDLCDRMISTSDELRGCYSTDYLREGIKRAETVADLHGLHEGIRELHAMLKQYGGPNAGVEEFLGEAQTALEKTEPQPKKHDV